MREIALTIMGNNYDIIAHGPGATRTGFFLQSRQTDGGEAVCSRSSALPVGGGQGMGCGWESQQAYTGHTTK